MNLVTEFEGPNCPLSPALKFHSQIFKGTRKRTLMGERGKFAKFPPSMLAHAT
jgi:hypothetical protein